MNIVFFGTPPFAFYILESLVKEGHTIKMVVTKADAVNHGRTISPPLKKMMNQNPTLKNIPIVQPHKMKDSDFQKALQATKADVFIVVMYGKILPSSVLYMAPYGCINVHPSLLPLYRGASPVRSALLNGDKVTGVSIMKLVEEMDAGDVFVQESIPIPSNMNHDQLEAALLELSAKLLKYVLLHLQKGIKAEPQDVSKVTFTKKMTQESCKIDVNADIEAIFNQIRALSIRPGAYVYIKIEDVFKRLKILEAEIVTHKKSLEPTLACSKEKVLLTLKQGELLLKKVQLEGKKMMDASAFALGIPFIKYVIK